MQKRLSSENRDDIVVQFPYRSRDVSPRARRIRFKFKRSKSQSSYLKMSENDPCECFWNHELSMQRLLSLLRQSQSACTDIDCLEPVQRLDAPLASSGEDTNFILLTGIWVVVALALYFMRPNQTRSEEDPIKKLPSGGSGNSGSDDPPPPPPSMGAQ